MQEQILFQAAVSAGLALSEAEQEEDQTLRTREIRPHGGCEQLPCLVETQ